MHTTHNKALNILNPIWSMFKSKIIAMKNTCICESLRSTATDINKKTGNDEKALSYSLLNESRIIEMLLFIFWRCNIRRVQLLGTVLLALYHTNIELNSNINKQFVYIICIIYPRMWYTLYWCWIEYNIILSFFFKFNVFDACTLCSSHWIHWNFKSINCVTMVNGALCLHV